MEDVFKVMDKDGDGRLSHDDLKSYMNCAGFAATDDDIKAMIRLGGEDENDGVSSPSFSKLVGVISRIKDSTRTRRNQRMV
ncbi:probable calcium-binding protein CML10 isoform X1 [Citrus clementina]|uniref:probable calcium-binding protein CML10 isoform X1 n=1 Tax=Citrus clementina TaxID=85681 RepID=UPI000CED0497|nr:probable calcium-binding protein CML10 isoform X1 [Citrus x clementina]